MFCNGYDHVAQTGHFGGQLGGQEVGQRIEIVADADPPLGACLESGRPASRERIEDDVAAPRVAP